jgi:peptidoglycan/LPS O-acetylase OafA/YrhL
VKRRVYFDLLRTIALVRVVTYHAMGGWWLHIAFPAIGVMFALAGSLMAASLDNRSPVRVVGARVRRLLPPVWLYAIIAIAVGWQVLGRNWSHLLYWLLPLRDPYDSSFGSGFVDTLWYLRTYLWFVLLSPVMLWAFRKAPALLLPLPMTLIPLVALTGGHLADQGLVADLLVYGTCWMLGFAEHDGLLGHVRMRWIATGGVVVGFLGLSLLFISPITPPTEASTVGYALWSSAVVVVLLRWRPTLSWLGARWRRIIEVVNARAVTIYLWHDAAIVLSLAIALPALPRLPIVFFLTAVAALLFGWVEDLAAGRRPRLVPALSPRSAAAPPLRTAPLETEPRSPRRVPASHSR